jgi:restriction system protein
MPTKGGWSDAATEAQRALAQEEAREAIRARREQLAEERLAAQERAATERKVRRRKVERGKVMAVARTKAVEDDVARLERILANGLRRDPYLDPELLKRPLRLPTFNAGRDAEPSPEPDPQEFLPQRPSTFTLMLPGGERRYERNLTEARTRYETAVAEHHRQEEQRQKRLREARVKHEQTVAAIKKRVAQQHADIQALKAGLEAGQPRAVRDYCERVLAARPRLSGFPNRRRSVFIPDSNELIVEFELPGYGRISSTAAFTYVQSTDTLKPTLRPEKKRKELYQHVIAQLTLLTVRDVFEADRWGNIDAIVANGIVDGVDPATGKRVRPCVVSVCVTRDSYQHLDLSGVTPVACLTKLAAQLSPAQRSYRRSSLSWPRRSWMATTSQKWMCSPL